jgi:hypothetical protein
MTTPATAECILCGDPADANLIFEFTPADAGPICWNDVNGGTALSGIPIPIVECERCHRPSLYGIPEIAEWQRTIGRVSMVVDQSVDTWNCTVEDGQIIGLLCPDCQTPMENAEALIKEATLDYGIADDGSRYFATPKGGQPQ